MFTMLNKWEIFVNQIYLFNFIPMEELLNKLIEKGWKPRWYEDVYEFKLYKLWYTIARPQKQKMISFATETRHYINWTDYIWYKWYSLRELVSVESWLWQFVCENGMGVRKRQWTNRWWWEPEKCFDYKDYQYWLIESALKDEEDLEKFLIENINIS